MSGDTSIDPPPSLLLARPLTSLSQARRRNPGATPAGVTPHATGTAAPYFPRFGALPIWQTLTSFLASSLLLGRYDGQSACSLAWLE